MLWGMGQMGPVLVAVLFTLNSVTKLNSVKRLCCRTHLDTVARGHQRISSYYFAERPSRGPAPEILLRSTEDGLVLGGAKVLLHGERKGALHTPLKFVS